MKTIVKFIVVVGIVYVIYVLAYYFFLMYPVYKGGQESVTLVQVLKESFVFALIGLALPVYYFVKIQRRKVK